MGAINVSVQSILDDVKVGRVVLPDFQRSFIWKPDDIRDLVVSVLGGYYIGSMLFLDTIRDEAPFALRLIEGVEKVNPDAAIDSITKVLLDGQQRTSSLFYALYGPDMPLAGRKGAYKFFLNIPKLLLKEWDEAVAPVLVTSKKQFNEKRDSPDEICTTELRDIGLLMDRINNGPHKKYVTDLLRTVTSFTAYQIQMVQLDRGTPLDRIVETLSALIGPVNRFRLLTSWLPSSTETA